MITLAITINVAVVTTIMAIVTNLMAIAIKASTAIGFLYVEWVLKNERQWATAIAAAMACVGGEWQRQTKP